MRYRERRLQSWDLHWVRPHPGRHKSSLHKLQSTKREMCDSLFPVTGYYLKVCGYLLRFQDSGRARHLPRHDHLRYWLTLTSQFPAPASFTLAAPMKPLNRGHCTLSHAMTGRQECVGKFFEYGSVRLSYMIPLPTLYSDRFQSDKTRLSLTG